MTVFNLSLIESNDSLYGIKKFTLQAANASVPAELKVTDASTIREITQATDLESLLDAIQSNLDVLNGPCTCILVSLISVS